MFLSTMFSGLFAISERKIQNFRRLSDNVGDRGVYTIAVSENVFIFLSSNVQRKLVRCLHQEKQKNRMKSIYSTITNSSYWKI